MSCSQTLLEWEDGTGWSCVGLLKLTHLIAMQTNGGKNLKTFGTLFR